MQSRQAEAVLTGIGAEEMAYIQRAAPEELEKVGMGPLGCRDDTEVMIP